MVDQDPASLELLTSIRNNLRSMEQSMIFVMNANKDVMDSLYKQNKHLEKAQAHAADAHIAEQARTTRRLEGFARQQSYARGVGSEKFGSGFAGGLTKLGLSVVTVGKIFKDTLSQANTLQKAALSRGMSLTQVTKENAQLTEQLGKNLLSYSDSLDLGFEAFSRGLRTNNFAVGRLGAMAKITTGQQKELMKALAANTEGLGFNDTQITHLADTTMRLSQTFGLTVNELTDSINSLKSEMQTMALLGIAPEFQEAALALAAVAGPELKQLGPKLLSSLTDGSNLIKSSILGVSKERQAMLSPGGDKNAQAFDLMMKASDKAAQLGEQWTRGATDQTFALTQMEKVYGSQIRELAQWRRGLKEAAAARNMSEAAYVALVSKEQKIKEDFANTFDNFRKKILSPFQKLFTKFSKVLFKLMELPFATELVTAVVGLTTILVGVATASSILSSNIAQNTLASLKSTKAFLVGSKTTGGSGLLSALMWLIPGARGARGAQAALKGVSYRSTMAGSRGQFTQAPTGFWERIKSSFGIGKIKATTKTQDANAIAKAMNKSGTALRGMGGGSALKGIWVGIKRIVGKLGPIGLVIGTILSAFNEFKAVFSKFFNRIYEGTEGLRKQFSGAWSELSGTFSGLDKGMGGLGSTLAALVDMILIPLAELIVLVANVAMVVVWGFKWLFKGIKWVLEKVINPIIDAIATMTKTLADGLQKIWDKLPSLPKIFGGDDDAGVAGGPRGTGSIAADIDKYSVALKTYQNEGPQGQQQLNELVGLNKHQGDIASLLQQQNELLEEIVSAGYNPGGVRQPTTPVATRGGRGRR